MDEKTLLWIIVAITGLLLLLNIFTKKENGSVSFGLPKFSLPKKNTTDTQTPDK